MWQKSLQILAFKNCTLPLDILQKTFPTWHGSRDCGEGSCFLVPFIGGMLVGKWSIWGALFYDSHVHLPRNFRNGEKNFCCIRFLFLRSKFSSRFIAIASGVVDCLQVQSRNFFRTQEDHQTLDRHFDQLPVVLVTADGHGSWVNSCARKNCLSYFKIIWKQDLHETEKFKMDDLLPSWSLQELQSHLQWALDYFYQAGFGYLRDMGTDETSGMLWSHFGASKNKIIYWQICDQVFAGFENNKSFYTYVQKESHLISKGQLEFSGIKIFVIKFGIQNILDPLKTFRPWTTVDL